MEEFDLYEDEGDDGNPFSHVDWGEGWLWEEEYDVNVCNDRIRIEMHDVKWENKWNSSVDDILNYVQVHQINSGNDNT